MLKDDGTQGGLGEPALVVSSPEGQEVERGRFTAGCDLFPRWYFWRLPAELAAEYHVRLRMKTGPFEVDEAGNSVIRTPELRRQ